MTCLFLNKGLWIITELIMHINWKVPVDAIKIQKQAQNGKWEVGIKLFQQTSKAFCEFGLEAVALFHRRLCGKKHFSAFNFPTILRNRVRRYCPDVRLVRGRAAVSPHLSTPLKWKLLSGHIWCDHTSTLHPCPKLFLVCFGPEESLL